MGKRFANPYIYDAIAEQAARQPVIPVGAPESYGQCGEDLIVESLLRVLCLRTGAEMNEVRYVEIGGNHPIACSNTWLLRQRHGARGVVVEANPNLIADLQRLRPGDTIINKAVVADDRASVSLHVSQADELSSVVPGFAASFGRAEFAQTQAVDVPAVRIGKLLTETLAGARLSYVSIDVEGLDFELLRDIDFTQIRPSVLQLEPADHYHRGMGFRMMCLLEHAGYRLHGITDVNQIYVDARAFG